MRKAPGLRLQTAVVQDSVPAEVCAGLFVGSAHAGFDAEALRARRVTHVLNLAGAYATFPETFAYLSASVRDRESANLLSCLPVALVFIDGGLRAGGGVLVHCAGGRSRSPAVAVAFLMARRQLSLPDALARVKARRPLASLNAGFERQLRCLEAARGDVFLANQLLLQANARALGRQLRAGALLGRAAEQREAQAARRAAASRLARAEPPAGAVRLAPADERDMLCGCVPSGFCLSVPPPPPPPPAAAQAQAQALAPGSNGGGASSPAFVPALRSMGTVLGCRACGAGLFCASAILRHKASEAGGDAALAADATADASASAAEAAEAARKRPLLAKLRLRPQSPSVSRGRGAPAGKAPRPGGDARGGSAAAERRLGLLQTVRRRLPPRQGKYDKERSDGASSASSASSASRSASVEDMAPVDASASASGSASASASATAVATVTAAASRRGQALWRSIVTLKAAKCGFRDAASRREARGAGGSSGGDSSGGDSSGSAAALDAGDHAFLQDNARLWEQGIRQVLESAPADGAGGAEERSAARELAAVLDADARALEAALDAAGGCCSWSVEPQAWFLAAAAAAPAGEIRCPNGECAAVVGEWRWDGVRCSCNEWLQPAFAMRKERVRVLGVPTMRSGPQETAADVSAAVDKLRLTR